MSETQLTQLTQPSVILKSRAWLFTWHNFPEDYKEVLESTNYDKLICQQEIGENTNKLHLQGAIYYKNERSRKALTEIMKGIHLEVAKKWIACVNYCKKSKTAVAGTQIDTTKKPKFVFDDAFIVFGFEYKWWQQEIIDIINEDPRWTRSIHWYFDTTGGAGKTTFTKHLCGTYNAVILSGKASDMQYAIYNMPTKPTVVIIDIPRTAEDYVSYGGIEKIKDGCFFNTKYESGMCIYNSPHIICFANFPPKKESMSKDRWKIVDICQEELLYMS